MGQEITMDIRSQISAHDLDQFHARAMDMIAESRAIIRAAVATGFDVKKKPDGSYVTNVDLKVEEHLRGLIQRHFPEHGIIGEEYPPTRPDAVFQWIMDPIDGTEDFVYRVPTFGTILALHYRGQPVVGILDHPMLDLCVSAAYGRGTFNNGERVMLADIDPAAIDGSERVMLSARSNFTRFGDDGHLFDTIARAHPNHRIYRSCYAHACAAIGTADATIDYANRLWDIAACQILIEEAGGKYVVVHEDEVRGVGHLYSTVFGKPTLVDRLTQYFNQ
jgi:fructose-1,6-bisphosphatase/inositol monophosphatase family enzyme